MKQQIAGSRHGVAPAGADFTKRVQLHRPRGAEQPVPRLGPKSHHARKSRFDVAKVHGAIERREVCAERAHCASVLRARLYGQHQKNRGARQRRGDRLSQSEHALRRIVRVLGIGFHRLSSWRRARNLVYFDSASTPPPTFGRQAYHRPPTNVHSASARAGQPPTSPVGGLSLAEAAPQRGSSSSKARFTAITVFPRTHVCHIINGIAWSARRIFRLGRVRFFFSDSPHVAASSQRQEALWVTAPNFFRC